MNLLIDTHAVIWFITENEKLPIKTRKIIESAENTCFISIASYWELAIKNSLGRLNLGRPLADIFTIITETGFELLPIDLNHILTNTTLAFHHYDPFDRIIIAQAITENLLIITKDEKFDLYPVSLKWDK